MSTVRLWFTASLLVTAFVACAPEAEPAFAGEEATSKSATTEHEPRVAHAELLPTPERWLAHLTDELLPYWTMPAALGTPVGNFPTSRCNDGSVYDAATNPCPELHEAAAWIRSELGREYTRMKSRQTWAYGAAFHMTGDPALLDLHLQGVRWLLDNAIVDEGRGGAVTFFENGAPDVATEERTSQDLAYATLGIAMSYYLTRDPAVLEVLTNLEAHIFDHYDDPALGMLRWSDAEPGSQELVAQLDQLNAYLVLAYPVLPGAVQERWAGDMRRSADVIREKFYAPDLGLFFGRVDGSAAVVGSDHTDFGHTIKTFATLAMTSRLLGDDEGAAAAVEGSWPTLRAAYITPSTPFGDAGAFQFDRDAYVGGWAEKLTGQEGAAPYASVWPGTEWWSHAELDQAASSWLVVAPDAAAGAGLDLPAMLATTTKSYFERLVDPVHGGVFHKRTNRDLVEFAKCHLWKNAYHEVEHALVGYLTSSHVQGSDVELHFAFAANAVNEKLVPYTFSGEGIDLSAVLAQDTFGGPDGSYRLVRARFSSLTR